LLSHLANRLGELLRKVKKETTTPKVRPMFQPAIFGSRGSSQAPNIAKRTYCKVADLIDDRHQDVRVTVGFGRLLEKIIVDDIEADFGPLLVIKDLDDPLAVGQFFDIAIGFG
jgi:hypothetical protein